MIKSTIYSSFLLAACARAAVVALEARFAHGTCSFEATHTQLCSPSSPERPINYISIAMIVGGDGKDITDAREQGPLNQFNSFKNLNEEPWEILVKDNELASGQGEITKRQSPKILSVTTGDDDTIAFKYGDEEWTSEDEKAEGRGSWCEVQPWDQEDWKCVNGQTIDPEVQCVTSPCRVDSSHDSLRGRQMKCYFTC